MSARPGRGLVLLFLLGALHPAEGEGFIFEDPFKTRPPVFYRGATLPGEDAPIGCPAKFSSPLSLNDALDISLCNNSRVRSSWAEIRVRAASLGEAKAAYLPTLSGSVNRIGDQTRYPGSNINPTNLYSNTVFSSLSYRLFDFGAREARSSAANAYLLAAISSHDATLQKVMGEVIQAYFDSQSSRAESDARKEGEAIARISLETAQRREEEGSGAQSDTQQAAAALAKAKLERSRAEGRYFKSIAILQNAIGLAPENKLELAEDSADRAIESVEELQEWIKAARDRHPEISAAREELHAAEEKARAARLEGLPTIDLSGNYYQNGRPNQGLTPARSTERMIGISLSVPIFEGFSRTYKVRGAEAEIEKSQASLEDTEHRILLEVVKAHADAASALSNLTASEAYLSAAEKSFSSIQRKFEKGATDILEILNAQAALSDARLERVRCLSEWRSARLRLFASTGLLNRK